MARSFAEEDDHCKSYFSYNSIVLTTHLTLSAHTAACVQVPYPMMLLLVKPSVDIMGDFMEQLFVENLRAII